MNSAPCPDGKALHGFALDRLANDARQEISQHLSSCAACRLAVEEISRRHAVPETAKWPAEAARRSTAPVPSDRPRSHDQDPAPFGYELLEVIGQGGMGVVYRARDLRLNRLVAIKAPRGDWGAQPEAMARFVAESQITGRLQHPGIPPVHELATMPDGRPLLSMKLVHGRTLQELLAERTSPDLDRGRFVAVFEQVCQAVGYAHAQGVIHRDLKPGNVMVGEFGEVQVMDWGLAKTVGGRTITPLMESPLASAASPPGSDTGGAGGSNTQTGEVLGTAAFMAPEQARGDVEEIDPRSDVFGLGAILCSILTGAPPYTAKDLATLLGQATRGELQDAWRRLDECGAETELVALCRNCLAPAKQQRPADGAAVAREITSIRQTAERRLRQAELDSQQARVLAAEERRRRRLIIRAAVTVAAVLLCGVVGVSMGMLDARASARAEASAKNVAMNREREARQAQAAERSARIQSERRLAQVEKGVDLFAGLLTGINPENERPGEPPLYDQLRARAADAADKLADDSVGDPEVVARLQSMLGRVLREFDEPKKAVALFEKAEATQSRLLGPSHRDTLVSRSGLASAYLQEGRHSQAIRLFQQTLSLMEEHLGPEDPDTLATLNNMAVAYRATGRVAESIQQHQRVHALLAAKFGDEHPDTLSALSNLAAGYLYAGDLPRATSLLHQLVKASERALGEDHATTLSAKDQLAGAHLRANELQAAIDLYQAVYAARSKKFGENSPQSLATLRDLATAYRFSGRRKQAIELLERLRIADENRLGARHPDTLTTLHNLAGAYQYGGDRAKAIELFEMVYSARQETLGEEHPDTVSTAAALAVAREESGDVAQALLLWEKAADAVERRGFSHQSALDIVARSARAFERASLWTKAETLRRKWLSHMKRQRGVQSTGYAAALVGLGATLALEGKWSEAEPVLAEALALRRRLSPGTWSTFNSMSTLGVVLARQEKYAAAEPLLIEGYEGMRDRQAQIPPQGQHLVIECLEHVVDLYDAWGKPAEADRYRQLLPVQPPAPY